MPFIDNFTTLDPLTWTASAEGSGSFDDQAPNPGVFLDLPASGDAVNISSEGKKIWPATPGRWQLAVGGMEPPASGAHIASLEWRSVQTYLDPNLGSIPAYSLAVFWLVDADQSRLLLQVGQNGSFVEYDIALSTPALHGSERLLRLQILPDTPTTTLVVGSSSVIPVPPAAPVWTSVSVPFVLPVSAYIRLRGSRLDSSEEDLSQWFLSE